MTILLDTNVLVYDAIENSPHHKVAVDIIDESKDPVVNSISIIELGFVLPRYGIENNGVQKKLGELLNGDYFTISWINGRMLKGASEFIVENKLSFREFNDWIIAYDAHFRSIPLATFDVSLSRKCKRLGIKVAEE